MYSGLVEVYNVCVLGLCLFDAIVELHAMDEKTFTHFLIGK